MVAARRWLFLSIVACLSGWGCSSTESIRPASLSITSGDGQIAPARSPLEPFVVTVLGSDGRPYAGATVRWQVVGGGGSLSVTSAVTDAEGQASTVLTLGSGFGVVTVEASTAGVPAQVFAVTAVDPCEYIVAHTHGGSSNGSLSTFDCLLNDGSYIDYFGFTTSAQGLQVDVAATFDTYAFLFTSSGAVLGADDDGGEGTNSTIRAIVPPGNYLIGANSYLGGVAGPYTVSSSTIAESATGCLEYWIARGVQSSQTLSTLDCASSGSYGDVFSIFLTAGQTVTMSQSSAAFDAFLGLVNSNNTVVASDDDSGPGTDAQFSYTVTVTGAYYIVATSYTTGAVGSYTLTIQ